MSRIKRLLESAPWTLGVDPGSVSGWALYSPSCRPELWGKTGRPGHPTTGADVYNVLERCGEHMPRGDWPPVLGVESQFIPRAAGKGQGARHKAVSVLKTAACTGRWCGVCERYGLHLVEYAGDVGIPVNVWRHAQWGRSRMSEDEAKQLAVQLAERIWGIRIMITHHHTAEAMFIAAFAQQHELLKNTR